MAEIQHRCVICEADFRPGALDKEGKCPTCAKEYPKAKNKLEAIAANKPDVHIEPELTESRVRQLIREEVNQALAEYTAAGRPKSGGKS